MTQRLWFLMGILSLALCLTACSAPNDSSSSTTHTIEQTFHKRLKGEPQLLNPILSTDAYSSDVEGLIYSGLFRINDHLELEPDLLHHYEVSEDGKTFTFYLKKHVLWHDGYPLTAEDVVFTFERILDPATNTVRRSNFVINGEPVRFKALDKHTVQATLSEPFAPFLIRVAMEIIPKHIFESEDINTTPRNRQPIGTGPFMFKEWKTGQYIKLERNPHYYGNTPKLDHIVFHVIPDDNTALVALQKGEIDACGIPPKDYPRFKPLSFLNIFQIESLSYSYMGFNLTNPHFKHPNVRQAIVHAVNRNAIIKGIYKGFGSPAHLPSSPVSWAYPPAEKVHTYDYDPERSRTLLKNAGYVMNPSSKIVEKNGTPLTFTLLTSKGSPTGTKTAETIQRFLANVGIGVTIRSMEWQSFIAILNDPTPSKNFDAAMLGWSLGIDPDGYSIWHSSQFPKGFNFIGYNNPDVDTLLVEGRRELNPKKRATIYHDLFSHIAKDAPYLFLVYPKSIVAVNKRVHGLSEPGPAGLFNQIEDIYIKY